MRLAPVPMFFHPDSAEAARWAGESSRTTHGAPECVESCQLLAAMICAALSGASKDEVLFSHDLSTFQSAKFVELQRLLPRERASELGRSAPVRSR